MRGRSEHHGRIVRTDYCKQTGTFVAEEERHPVLLQLALSHALSGIPLPVAPPPRPDDGPEKGKSK
jgi:hypothetical protein